MTAPADHGWASGPAVQTVTPEDLRPGDVVIFLGQHHVIARIDPYDGPNTAHGIFAEAVAADGWGIALGRGVPVTIATRPATRKDPRP